MGRGSLARTLVDEQVSGRPWLGEQSSAPDLKDPGAQAATGSEAWYVVVDELLDTLAVVHTTPWPVVDDRGRLRFPHRERGFTARADAARLRALADAARRPPRPLRVGDVFRAVFPRPATRTAEDFCDVLTGAGGGGPLVDVSRAARESAKVQYSAAVAPVLDEDETWELYRDLAPGDREGSGS